MIKTYYMLTKPGIIMGNVITTAAGFALASKGNINYILFLVTMLGLGLVIASAGIFNNYLDRISDGKMERTKNRPLVQKLINENYALLFAGILGFVGFAILALYTNPLTVYLSIAGFLIYLILYAIWKYKSIHGTFIGSISGALPPVIGYCAVSNRLDGGAFILFAILVLWQMPHFFAIAMYRFDDYKAASIPVLPVVKGMHHTKIQMLLYIPLFIVASLLLTVYGYTGYIYAAAALTVGLFWFGLGIKGFNQENDQLWARKMFGFSLIVIMVLSLVMSVDVIKNPSVPLAFL